MSATVMLREVTLSYGPRKRVLNPLRDSRGLAALEPVAEIAGKLVEHFVAVAVDARHRPVAWTTIAIGVETACPVTPADVFRFVIMTGTSRFLVAHNHPSGDVGPSAEDLLLTQKLIEGGKILGLHLLDHVIVAENGSCSMRDAGLI